MPHREFAMTVLCFGLLTLSACGFSPVYGTSSSSENASVKSQLNEIEIGIIPNREGQFLRNALIDRFYFNGAPQSPAYNLSLSKINETSYDFDITQDSEATRRQIKLKTVLTLSDKETKKVLLKRNLTSVASYNVLESEFSTLVTEQNTRENTLSDLARQIEREITLYFNR